MGSAPRFIAAGSRARLETLKAGIPVFYRDWKQNLDVMEQPDGRKFEVRFIAGAPRESNYRVIRELDRDGSLTCAGSDRFCRAERLRKEQPDPASRVRGPRKSFYALSVKASRCLVLRFRSSHTYFAALRLLPASGEQSPRSPDIGIVDWYFNETPAFRQ